MYWIPLRRPDFPHYASGGFDFNVGRDAPPSFHLSCEGRSVAFVYSGPGTRVRTNSEYRIEGFIRPDRLVNARACLSAHWIDKDGKDIADSLVRSRFVGGSADGDAWVQVELRLPPAPPAAHTVGLVAWVLQEAQWDPDAPGPRRILSTDVQAGAWFDDLRVVRMPRMELATSSPANVLSPRSPQELRVLLADPDDSSLTGRVTVTDVEGHVVATHSVRVVLDAFAEPRRISVRDLPPGLYHAVFEVASGSTSIARQEVTFAILASLAERTETATRSFGVSLDASSLREPLAEAELLREQLVRSAKIPVWTAESNRRSDAERISLMHESLRDLTHSGFVLTAVLAAAPSDLARKRRSDTETLVDLLNADSSIWEENLACRAAPLSDVFAWWQLGADDAPLLDWDEKPRRATNALRHFLRRYVALPQLSVPLPANKQWGSADLDVEGVSLDASELLHPSELARNIADSKRQLQKRTSAFIAPLGENYERLPRLADWARRLISARHSGVDGVFVPQPWSIRPAPQGLIAEPDETFLLLRTIAHAIGDAVPGPRLSLGPGVECLTFRSGDSATFVLWDNNAPAGGAERVIQLGSAARQIDLWGNPRPMPCGENGERTVRLSPLPVVVFDVPAWLADLQTAFNLTPKQVEAGAGTAELLLSAKYEGNRSIAAHAALTFPPGWVVFPREFDVHLFPFRPAQFPMSAQIPSGEAAGSKSIRLTVKLIDEACEFEVPLVIEIALSDLDVSGTAVVQGDKLLLRQVVTNRSTTALGFRAAAAVPGRERQHRPLTDLLPGETQTVEYRFPGGRDLIGRRVRLSLNETNDGPRTHVLELTVP